MIVLMLSILTVQILRSLLNAERADKLIDTVFGTSTALQIEAAIPEQKLNLKLENYYDSDEWNIFGGELFAQSSSSSSNVNTEYESKTTITHNVITAASEASNDGDLILSEFNH